MTLFLVGLGLGLAGAIVGAIFPVRPRVLGTAVCGSGACVVTFIAATRVLASGHSVTFHSGAILPLTGVDLTLDPLGALFIATTAVVGLAASCYSIGYAEQALRSRTATAMFPLFLTSLLLIPATSSVSTFLVAWELMALTSMLLLLVEHRHREATRDAYQWYASMTHIGAAAILIGLVLLATHAGGQTFTDIRTHATTLSPALRSIAFLLVLVGFASKAGAVPLHVWLPRAHPEAPSPVSALMSGAMVNLGVYGIIRVGSELLGGGFLWWWLVVIALGVVSALYGALHASASSDLKRLLAYSTVDNIGLVLIGVGAAGALSVNGHRSLAALAMLAALFHLVNHSAFKGCLFLGAGAVERATGTRDLDRLGGLARRLRFTTVLFAIGALSISALPGFNGFASEWLLLESLLQGFAAHGTATLVALLAGVAALALTGGLTAAAFVKALGIGFLGQPRSDGAANAHEVAPLMVAGMALLAIPCLVIGVAPGLLATALNRASGVALGASAASPLRSGLGLDLSDLEGAIEPLLLVVAVLAAMLLSFGLVRLVARRGVRSAEAWGCGRELQTARMEYTATSFAEPLGRVFADVLRPDHDIEVTHVAESRYFAQAIRYQTRADDGIERAVYRPVISLVAIWGAYARRAQNGSVHRYLAYGFVALVVVLVALA
jgi:hydrogenase-4 component B